MITTNNVCIEHHTDLVFYMLNTTAVKYIQRVTWTWLSGGRVPLIAPEENAAAVAYIFRKPRETFVRARDVWNFWLSSNNYNHYSNTRCVLLYSHEHGVGIYRTEKKKCTYARSCKEYRPSLRPIVTAPTQNAIVCAIYRFTVHSWCESLKTLQKQNSSFSSKSCAAGLDSAVKH